MGRTTRSAKMDSRTARARLATGERHQEPLGDALTLVYRRPEGGGPGVWSARLRPAGGREALERIGVSDDLLDADGERILDHAQAVAAAAAWAKAKRHAWEDEAAGIAPKPAPEPTKPYTVADAWTDYAKDAERRGVRGLAIYQQVYNRWIEGQLGSTEVMKLTREQIEKWHADMATTPKTVHRAEPKPPKRTYKWKVPPTPKVKEPVPPKAKEPEEQARARKDSANRVLTNLKAALNFALDRGKVTAAPWALVKPFKNVAQQRLRFLSTDEQLRLVQACDQVDQELAALVRGALHTGARYNELCLVLVRDFDLKGRTLFIRHGKGQGASVARHVLLTGEAVAFFAALVKGRGKDEPMFARKNVTRTKRKHLEEFGGWGAYDADYALAKAVVLAKIERVTFHELRHTYASDLVNAGVPLAMVAKQLGHVGTRMVEKHYGHLAAEAMRQALATKLPLKGI